MYKRKVRILFLAVHPAACAQVAEGYARCLGAGWLECRSAYPILSREDPPVHAFSEGNGVSEGLPPAPLTEDMLEWADLVVTLGGREEGFDLPLPPGTRRKHWDLTEFVQGHGMDEQNRVRSHSVQDEIQRRVQGIIGGIRLLARSDSGSPDGRGSSAE